MSLRTQLSKITRLFRSRRADDLDEEIRVHLKMEEQENIDSGMLKEEARFAALRRFGNVTIAQEKSRGVWGWNFSEQLLQDLRFGLRQMGRNPAFTTTAVITLALAMGATTAIFSLTNALLLKSLPVPEPERLVQLTHGTSGDRGPSLSYPLFESLRKRNAAGVDLLGFSYAHVQFVSGPIQRTGESVQLVSGNFYDALKIRPELGRLLSPSNDKAAGNFSNAAVISDRLWRSGFHGDAGVVGKKILLDGVPFIVIGVLPRGFFGVVPGEYTDIAITFAGLPVLFPRQTMLSCRECNSMEAMGRLGLAVTVLQAEAGLNVAWRSALRETVPENLPDRYRNDYFSDHAFLDPAGNGLDSYLRDKFTKPLYLLLGMSGLILLIACSNVANLLLARAHARHRELAVRLSTGASQRRIMQQLLTESLLLAVFGLAASTVVYQACAGGLLMFMQQSGQEVFLDIKPDARMMTFALGLMTLTVLLCGLAPAVRASRIGLHGTLAESAPAASRKSRLGLGMLAAQIAMSIILLTGALQLTRSLHSMRTFDAGFQHDHLLIVSPDVGKVIPRPADQLRFRRRLISRIRGLPAIRSVSESTLLPILRGAWLADFAADGRVPGGKQDASCYLNFVSPSYFETMGTPLVLGRDFAERDERPGAPSVAIVSESLARHFWGKDNPIGKQIHESEKPEHFAVIGVARDAKNRSLRDEAPRTIYLRFPPPVIGMAWSYPFEIRTLPHPAALIAPIRKLFQEENSQIPVEFQTFDELMDMKLLSERLLSVIAMSFGALGLLMAATGIYGAAAYSVSRRQLEVGIRMAVGATKPRILHLFLSEHLVLSVAGVSIGVAGALALTQFLRAWLFGISALDIPSFAGSVALLAGVSVLAILIPALRIVNVEPSRLLRME